MSQQRENRRPVVVTGIGLVTAFGIGVEEYWRATAAGASGICGVAHFDAAGLPSRIIAYLNEALPEMPDPPDAEPRFARFALSAATEASKYAGWPGQVDPRRTGVFIGTSGEKIGLSRFARMVHDATRRNADPLPTRFVQIWHEEMESRAIARLFPQYASVRVAQEFGVLGPVTTVNTACTSSAHAIGEAYRAVQRGAVDLAVAGGTECIASQIGLQIFSRLGVLSRRNDAPERASRPFDLGRDGFVLGEGSGMLILESLESAKNRGAAVLAELAGYGTACDAYRITDEAPDGRGAILAMRKALDDASMEVERIDYINAHGTSTQMNDRVETQAIKAVFGKRAYDVPISSVKSMIGHTISAAGAIELITCILALRDRLAPPTINYETPDPDCDLDYVPNQARPLPMESALSNSFGFGGHNDCLIVRRLSE